MPDHSAQASLPGPGEIEARWYGPERFEKDEFGQYVCPLVDAWMVYDEGHENLHRQNKPCRAPLYVALSGSIPIADDVAPYTFDNAVASAWQVECENGHVLLRSAAEEVAEPFAVDFLLQVRHPND